MIDVRKIHYDVAITLKDGEVVRLNRHNKLLLGLTWGDEGRGIAARANIEIPQVKYKGKWLSNYVAVMCPVQVFADGEVVFEGTVWYWNYDSRNSDRRTTIVCYDRLKFLMNSEDAVYYTAGQSTQFIIGDICRRHNIPLHYNWESIVHERLMFNGRRIAEMIMETIREAELERGRTCVVLWRNGRMEVVRKGQNRDVYVFEAERNAIRTRDRISMDNVVTRVKIVARTTRTDIISPIEETVVGDLRFGEITRFIRRTQDTTIERARAEANEMLSENRNPERIISPVEVADVPALRKGDVVLMKAGSLAERYWVKSVTHNAVRRRMTMELEPVNN